jgi:thiamine-phosphate pyrophosphorylase
LARDGAAVNCGVILHDMIAAPKFTMPAHLKRPRLRGLYVITDYRMGGGHVAIARAALEGGAAIIQLRDKSGALLPLLAAGREIRHLTRAAGALFIVNDRVDVALAIDADGVHLGPDDLPPVAARRLLGPHRLVGVSCGTPQEAAQAAAEGADYIGVGALFATATKADAGSPIGIEGLREIVASTSRPVAAIGGLGPLNMGDVAAAGAAMACVVSAVARAGSHQDMVAATRALVAAFGTPATATLKFAAHGP